MTDQQMKDPPAESVAQSPPYDALEKEWRTIEPVWGKGEASSLNTRLRKDKGYCAQYTCPHCQNINVIEMADSASLWGELEYLTRDVRLANLSGGEVAEVRHYLDLAGDCLKLGYIGAFRVSIQRAATILEVSQSKRGFLRRRMGTITQEKMEGNMETNKKKLLGGRKE